MSASPAKAKKAAKPRKPAAHPKYIEMITKAITDLKERGGSSRTAILKYITKNFKVDQKSANVHLKLALRNGVKSGALKQVKGVGASGSFRVGEKKTAKKAKKPAKKAAKKPAKKAAKKPAGEKKAAKPKKPAAKKVKKPKSPKKAKTPAKKAAKPKAKAAKKPAAKKAAKKSPKKGKK